MGMFTIPKGKDITFKVYILEDDGVTIQNLDNFDNDNSSFKLVNPITDTVLPTDDITLEVTDSEKGELSITLGKDLTSTLTIRQGDTADWYYRKPSYKGIISIEFTDETSSKLALIDKIYVIQG